MTFAASCGEVVPKDKTDASSGIDAIIQGVCGDGRMDPDEQCDGPVVGPNAICEDCRVVCVGGFENCTGDPAQGCVTDIFSDPQHCGGCENACPDSSSCMNGQCQFESNKLVFISNEVVYGDFGGIYQADDMCQGWAAQVGHPGEFRAWISSEEASVVDRFQQHDGPYVLVDGTIIADGWFDLTDGQLNVPIYLTEYGTQLGQWPNVCHGGPTCTQVFTATDANGRYTPGPNADCNGWSQPGPLSYFTGGDSIYESVEWTLRASGLRCDYAARLYCFEQ